MSKPTAAPSLFDTPEVAALARMPVPLHANARPTERLAAESMAGLAPVLRMEVLEQIRTAGEYGRTGKELGRWLAGIRGVAPNDGTCRYTVAPRCTELFQAGFIADSGKVREKATVWVATAKDGDGRDARKPKLTKEPTP